MTLSRILLFSGFAALALLPRAAQAQASLTFSGGGGTPLTLTLASPITYTITTATGAGPLFLFQGVGNIFSSVPTVTGTITYSKNGGAATSLQNIRSGLALNNVAATDAYMYNNSALSSLAIGDTVTLSAGTLTTGSSIVSPAPASGNYSSYIVDGNGVRVSGPGAPAAPEPGTLALLALGAFSGLIPLRRRNRP
jgi:hypothetical protein